MRSPLVVLLVVSPALVHAEIPPQQQPEPCRPPSVSFRWVGAHALFLTTDAKFAPLNGPTVVPGIVTAAMDMRPDDGRRWTGSAERKAPAESEAFTGAGSGPERVPSVKVTHAPGPAGAAEPSARRAFATPAPPIPRLVVLGTTATQSGPKQHDTTLLEVFDVVDVRYPSAIPGAGPQAQTFRVDADKVRLLRDGGRVSVAFVGLEDCHRPGIPQAQALVVQDAVALEQHHLAVDLGVAYSLDADGSFKAHPELSLNAHSRWMGFLSGDVDVRVTKLDPVEPPPSPGAPPDQQRFLQTGGTTLDTAGRIFANLDFSSGWYPTLAPEGSQPSFALAGGAGLRTMTSGSTPDVRLRYFGGARVQVLGFNAGAPAESFADTRGYLEVGAARDQFWQDTSRDRFYAEGQLEIPALGNRWVRLLTRLRMDRPLRETGASEVRLSVLTSIDPAAFKALLGGS